MPIIVTTVLGKQQTGAVDVLWSIQTGFFLNYCDCDLSICVCTKIAKMGTQPILVTNRKHSSTAIPFWWLVRVTLVVDWLFLPQNFGPVVGTYEGLLWLCECTLGGGSIFRWWGHLTTICTNRTFSCCRW